MSSLAGAISACASALNAQRARMEVAVSNLANAESTHGPDGQPYRRRDIVLSASPIESFDSALGRADAVGGNVTADAVGVKVTAVLEDSQPFRRRFEPSHPDADKEGFVSMPNVDVPEEMVDMLGAARAYQANLTAISIIRDTIQKALELGR